jgi:hypothetical protein
MLERLGCTSRSHIEKHINKIVWETLSRARHVDEKLAWDGEESEVGRVGEGNEDIFFTPSQSPIKNKCWVQCCVKYPKSFGLEWCYSFYYCGGTNKSKTCIFKILCM